jgi:hypothetical protein
LFDLRFFVISSLPLHTTSLPCVLCSSTPYLCPILASTDGASGYNFRDPNGHSPCVCSVTNIRVYRYLDVIDGVVRIIYDGEGEAELAVTVSLTSDGLEFLFCVLQVGSRIARRDIGKMMSSEQSTDRTSTLHICKNTHTNITCSHVVKACQWSTIVSLAQYCRPSMSSIHR